MTQDEIVELAKQAGFYRDSPMYYDEEMLGKFFRLAYARGMLQSEKNYMQLFLDPENQPTQFGTATQEYRDQEILEEREACAKTCDEFGEEWNCRSTTNEIAAAIRAKGKE